MIDEFLLNPGEVVAYAASREPAFQVQERAYPGKVLPLGGEQVFELHRFVRTRLSRAFSFLRGDVRNQTRLSLTTLQPEEFTWIQRLPHSDPRLGEGRENYAALVYLFDNPALGGTGFYRWKNPEFWPEITARQIDDPEGDLDLLRERFAMFREPPRYPCESNDAVDLLATVPARFNRLVCYSGDLPHSAHITDPGLLTHDCTRGRLTLDCFASVVPKRLA